MYTILSSISVPLLKKRENMNGVLGMMTGALGGSFIDSISNAQNSAAQINHNQNIINQQTAASQNLTKFQQDEAFKMWKKTNYKAQVEEMKKAVLNVWQLKDILIYFSW